MNPKTSTTDKAAQSGASRRKTEQRAAIVTALQHSDRALTAQELHDDLRDVGLATVYRNLGRLAEDGEIDAIRRPNGETAYRACGAGHHHHLICRECGRVVELHDCSLDDWSRKIAKKHGFVGVEHQAELLGTCERCATRA